jgi:hypothetical protein
VNPGGDGACWGRIPGGSVWAVWALSQTGPQTRSAPKRALRRTELLGADAGHAVRPPVSVERRGCSGDDGGRHDAPAEELSELRAVPEAVRLLRHRGVGARRVGGKWAGRAF